MIRGTGIDSTVKLYLKGNGANGSTKFFDDSQSHNTINVNGNVQISTAEYKFGWSSIKFGGALSDYLSIPYNSNLQEIHKGSINWSIGFFVNGETPITTYGWDIIGGTVPSANIGFNIRLNRDRKIIISIGRGISGQAPLAYTSSSAAFTADGLLHWIYISFNKDSSGSEYKIYSDGSLIGTTTNEYPYSTSNCTYSTMLLGLTRDSSGNLVAGTEFAGYLDDLRVIIGNPVSTTDPTKVPTRHVG